MFTTETQQFTRVLTDKLAELKTLFEEQAKSHHLYPYITWDDVFHGRIHRIPGSRSYFDAQKDVTKSGEKQ